MKFTLKIEIDKPDTMAAGLTVDNDADVRMARERLTNLQDEARRADQRLHADASRVEELRVLVGAGEARIDELEAAIVTQRAGALVYPQYAERVALAGKAVDQAIADAKARIMADLGRRRDKLQRVLSTDVAPMLQAFREAEAALDACSHAVKPGSCVVPLEWPQSLDDEGALRNARIQSVGPRGAA